jgi:hypothetical protein
MSTIEGGMICTNDSNVYDYARMLRSHGMVRELDNKELKFDYIKNNPELNPDFIFSYPAYNVRNTEIGGILGLSQLKRIDEIVAMRTENLIYFLEHIDGKKYRKDYPVRSDFIGVKFRVLDYGSRALIVGNTDSNDFTYQDKYAFDLGIDGYTFRVLHYAVSMNLNEDWRFSSPNYYQLSLGFRMPLSIFSWVTDFNVRSQLKGEGYAFLSSGLSLRFDCNRKFNRKDKLKIKAEKFS